MQAFLRISRASILLALLLAVLVAASGCVSSSVRQAPPSGNEIVHIESFREIPGMTPEEINQIEALIDSYESFSYGQMLETEAFMMPDGTYAGFVVDFTQLLTGLFGIEFNLEIHDWDTLRSGIDNMLIDFTSDFIAIPERTQYYHMSLPIAERSHRLYMTQENFDKFLTLQDIAGKRIGRLQGSVEADHVLRFYPELDVEFICADNLEIGIGMLATGEIDAFLIKAVHDPAFEQRGISHYRDMFPLVYTSVALSTANPELIPIINAINKYISAGGIDTLQELYRHGDDMYIRHKLSRSFTPEERAYLDDLDANKRTVKAALQIGNYPICFYNETEERFHGIVIDLLDEVSKYTGIIFEPANSGMAQWPEILKMLEAGEAQVISQLLYSPDREGQYLWPDRPTATSYYALLSRYDYPTLANYQVVRSKVGTVTGSAFADVYREWFPASDNLTLYNTQIEALDALESGEIDLMMGSDYLLLMQQNYYEKPGYKINIRFPVPMDSYLGFNVNEQQLCGIVSKSLDYVDLDTIVNDWTSRGYDYVATITQQRMIYSMIMAVCLAFTLVLAIFFIIRLRIRDKELSLQRELAQEASVAKSAFLANMSHEMRTPLTSVIGLSELTLRTANLNEETRGNLVKVYRAGETLLGLINDILDISKIEANKFELIESEYDFPSVLNDTITQSLLYIGEKPIEFILDISEDLPRRLFGDELRVKQIFNNLLSNAFKYTREGSVEFYVRCERDGDNIRLKARVTDSGIGIKAQDFDKLFTLYANMDKESKVHDNKRRIEGTGLGLSICKRIAEMMNGTISVQSEYGKGSVFTVELRQTHVDDSVFGHDVVESLKKFHYSIDKFKDSDNSRIDLSYARVLVVDDNTANLDVAKGLLSLYGLGVDCVTSGRTAVDAIQDEAIVYNAIFMDHMMPEMDGIEATQLIREIGTQYARDIPIIALTANAIIGNEEIFLKKGFQAFLSKPIDMTELDAVLRKWINNKFEGKPAVFTHNACDNNLPHPDVKNDAELVISGIDVKKLKSHYQNEAHIYLAALRSYVDNAAALVTKLQSVSQETLANYAINIHGLKGISSNICADEIAAEATELEKLSKSGEFGDIPDRNEALLRKVAALIREIKNWFDENKNGRDKPVLKCPDKEILRRLRESCKVFDITGVSNAMEELENADYETGGELIKWLRDKINDSRFTEIYERLQNGEL